LSTQLFKSCGNLFKLKHSRDWQHLASTRILFQKLFASSSQVFNFFQRTVGTVSCGQTFSTLCRRQSWHGDVMRQRSTSSKLFTPAVSVAMQGSKDLCKVVTDRKHLHSVPNIRYTTPGFDTTLC